MANSPIPGFKLLLMGHAKSGKTFCARSVADTELEGAVLFFEPSQGVIADVPCPKLHYAYVPINNMSWKSFKDLARNVAQLDNKNLQALPKGIGGSGQAAFLEFISVLNNFKCQRCGKDLGDVTQWGTDRILFLDGLTGLSKISSALAIGYKPIPTQVDWLVMQSTVDQVIYKLSIDLMCHFVLISHVRYRDDVALSGDKNMYVWTMGKSILNILPTYFHDVAVAYKKGSEFFWSTMERDSPAGGRFLPLSAQIPPTIGNLLSLWKSKGGIVHPGAGSPEQKKQETSSGG